MSLSPRDRKLLLAAVPVVLLAAFWFLILGPIRGEAASVKEEVAAKQDGRDAAVARVAALDRARATYAADYEALVRLGKAIPTATDMPSLMLQVDDAARGTAIDFRTITPGLRAAAAAGTAAPPPAPAAGAQTGVDPADTETSRDAREAAAPAVAAPVLEQVPLELAFSGGFFGLADFLHRQKRFVRVEDGDLLVEGRLMTVDAFTLSTAEGSRRLSVDMTASVYLSPRTPLPGPGAPAAAASAAPPAAPAPTASAGAPPVAAVTR